MSADWEVLRELFEGALERPPDQRAAYVHAQTAGNESLRLEIESLLAAHANADQFLTGRAFQSTTSPATAGHGSAVRLAPGIRLGAFEIVDLLGTGGMGEVYRARDTRLDRFVAIKVLSTDVDMAPRGRERFEREARAISKLSHPRICTMHDIGVADVDGREVAYLVMELLDGETLATRISRGPLPVEQSLTCAIDISDALIAAHSQGIVHRDLKPANVMLTSTGVKLLDFGLAQLRPSKDVAQESTSPRDPSLTSAGLVFGTLPYMSPEQLRGEKVDPRTDVFALGVLLHEMVTGQRPFAADSQAATVAAILEHDPGPISELQPLASPALDRVVERCLAKNPDDRWQTVRDLKSELIWVREGRVDVARARTAIRRPIEHAGRQWLLAGIPTLAAIALGVLLWRSSPPVPSPAPTRAVTRLSLNFPPGVTLDIPINGTSIAIAPDGSRIAFVGVREGHRSLFVHTLSSGSTVAIPDTRDATNPMFSPDSEWVAFAQGNAVRKLPAAGGPIQVLYESRQRQMTWLSDGRILRGAGGNSAVLHEVGVKNNREVTSIGPGEEGHHTPVLLANGSLLFTILRGSFQSTRNSVGVWGPGAKQAAELVTNATTPQLVGREALVFAQRRRLMAAGFDSGAVKLTGEPRALDVQVQTTSYSLAPMYAVAGNGTLVFAEAVRGRRLVWVDDRGREDDVKAEERMYAHLRISPDGTRVATYVADGDRDIWVLALNGSTAQKLTSGPARDAMPVWSPDGAQIFFTTAENQIYRIPGDRSSDPVKLFSVPSPERLHGLSITPDGKRLLTHWDLTARSGEIDLRILELGAKATLTQLVGESGTERDGRLSPDGRWLAFQSGDSTDRTEGHILVCPFPDVRSRRWVISSGIGRQPVWSRDGRAIFYRTEDGTVMRVPVQTKPVFRHDTPVRVVTPTNTLRDWGSGPTYDVSRDGRRFLFIKAPELDIRSLTVVLNWDVEVDATLARKEQ
jgi:serine/threonine protein kinase/Tol biopolymer transport system component